MTIHLKYDTKSIVKPAEHQLALKLMFWSAYLGLNEIVEFLIRQGYSPFARNLKKWNACMGAIRNNQKETLLMMLSFKYVPTDEKEFEKTRESTDRHGNNLLHIAYKFNRADMIKLLEHKEICSRVHRNHRGLVPS